MKKWIALILAFLKFLTGRKEPTEFEKLQAQVKEDIKPLDDKKEEVCNEQNEIDPVADSDKYQHNDIILQVIAAKRQRIFAAAGEALCYSREYKNPND